MRTPHTPRVDSESTHADSCIRIASGALIDLASPDPALLRIQDIAQSLAHTIRFSGHCPLQPTVAQHSLAVERIADLIAFDRGGLNLTARPERMLSLRRAALMHDAPEALVGDLAGPAKRWLRRAWDGGKRISKFDQLEMRATDAIVERFGIDFATYDTIIHEADVQACRFEASYERWSDTLPHPWVDLDPKVWLCYGFIEGVRVAPGHNGEMPFLRRAAQLGIA